MSKKSAFSLLEVLIAVLLFCTVAAITLTLFFQGHKVNRRLDYRLQALAAVHLVRARLAHDLASSMPSTGGTSEVLAARSLSLIRVQSGAPKGFMSTSLDENMTPITEKITYRYDEQKRLLYRNGIALAALGLYDLRFNYKPRTSSIAGDDIQVEMAIVPEEHKGSSQPGEIIRLSLDFHRTSTTWQAAFNEYAP